MKLDHKVWNPTSDSSEPCDTGINPWRQYPFPPHSRGRLADSLLHALPCAGVGAGFRIWLLDPHPGSAMSHSRRSFLTQSTAAQPWRARSRTYCRWWRTNQLLPGMAIASSCRPIPSGNSRTRIRAISNLNFELASDMGFDGVEILHRQMTNESNAYLQKLKSAFGSACICAGFLRIRGLFTPTRRFVRKTSITRFVASRWPTRWAFQSCV